MSPSEAELSASERRLRYRIDDEVGLRVSQVPEQAEKAALANAPALRERFAMVNRLLVMREQSLPKFRQIKRRMPEVAQYLRMLESQIEGIARVLGQNGSAMPEQATHEVSLSASGLSFSSKSAFALDTLLELKLVLFPERIQLFLYGRVVRVECELDPDLPVVSVSFDELPPEDEELLSKHIHRVQMRGLHTGD